MKRKIYQIFRMSILTVFLGAFTLNAQTGYIYFPDSEVAADLTTVATEVADPSTAEVDLTGDFTVQVAGTAGAEIVLSNGFIFYAYTPVVTGEVRIVKKGDTVYAFEGSELKGTIVSQDHVVSFPEITDVDAHNNAAQLLTNASFETTGGLADGSATNYKFGAPWVTNAVVGVSGGIRLSEDPALAENGNYVLIWRGSGNNNYFAQSVSGIKANTQYKVIVRQVTGANANADFMVGLGSTEGGLEHASSIVRLGSGYDGAQTAIVMAPFELSGEVYFTLKNTASNTSSDGTDPLTQIDYVALVEGAGGQSGITGASGSVYYTGGVYAPDQGVNFAAGDYYDMTSYIVNPSFEVGGFNGWTNSGMQTQTNDPSSQGWTKEGDVYVERWINNSSNLPASSVNQTVNGLPNGMYKLLAVGHAIIQITEPYVTEGAFLFAGSDQTPVNVGGEYEVADVVVVGGSLSIGFKLEGTITANWAGVDNFRLQYFGVDLTALNDLLTEKVADAQAILDATGNPAGYNKVELETAIANAAVVEQNEAALEAAINALETAIANFHEVVAAYGELKAALDFAATLSATSFPGKTEFDAAVATAQGVYDSTDDKTAQDFIDASVALKAAVQTYVLSQAIPANITGLLANPGFDVEPITFTETNGIANGTALVATRIYDIPGWNEELVSAWGRIATANYGITFDAIPDVLNGTTPPATDMAGSTEGAALKLSGSWGSPAVVTQDVTLPAGNYELSFEVINMSAGLSIGVNQFGFVPNAGDAVYGTTTLFADVWTTETVAFSLDAETAGKLSIGFTGAGGGAGANGKLYVDNVNLVYLGDVVTVTFDSNGGSAIEAQMVEKGSSITMPEAPTMDGNIFTGWYSDVALTAAWDFETTITEDLTLFAGWRVPSDLAELSNLTVNDVDVDGFAAGTYVYDVVLPAGTVDIPTVTATSADGNATVAIVDAEALPGATTVTVTAEDGTTELTYTLNFTVDLGTSLNAIGMGDVQVYPTVSNGRFTVDTNGQESKLTVLDMTGRVISVHETIVDEAVSIAKPGIYLLKVERNGVSKVFKVVKKN